MISRMETPLMIAAAYYVVIATDAARRAEEERAEPRPSVLARVRVLLATLGRRAVGQPA